MENGTALILILIGTIGCGFFAAIIAESKNRDGMAWFVVGAMLGPIGILVAGLMEKKEAEPGKTPHAADIQPIDVGTARPLAATSVVDELTKLADLRDRGALTENEFQTQKARLLG